MVASNDDRSLVTKYIMAATLPRILDNYILKMREQGFLQSIQKQVMDARIKVERQAAIQKRQLRIAGITIVELETSKGVRCTYKSGGYEKRLEITASSFKESSDSFLGEILFSQAINEPYGEGEQR